MKRSSHTEAGTPPVGVVGGVFLFFATAVVLVATLFPMGPAESNRGGGGFCSICGEGGLSDAIVNIILFVPLGIAAGTTGRSSRAVLGFGVALSAGVELAQGAIVPGRDASLSDLLFNTGGVAIGYALLKTSWWWLGHDRVRSARLSLAAACLVMGVISGTGLLLAPDFPPRPYVVMWAPDLKHLARYSGPISSATLAGEDLPPQRIQETTRLRALLAAGKPIRVAGEAAPAPARQAAMLAIHDDLKREVLLLGPDREDLVFRIRTRAASIRLTQPELRVFGAWRAVEPGSDVMVSVSRSGRRYCLGFGPRPACTSGFTAGMGWSLLVRIAHGPEWLQTSLSGAWLGTLALMVGFWARRRWESLGALMVLAVAILAVPTTVNLLFTPAPELLAALAGLGLGIWLRRLAVEDVDATGRASRHPY